MEAEGLSFGDELKMDSHSVSLHVAASNKDATTLQHLMKDQQHVENLNMMDSLKRTPLDCAGLSGSLECVEILLANGADPTNRTWIHSVCEGGNIAIIKLLLKKGIYHEHPDASGRWPIDLAFQSGHEDIVEYLRSIKCLEIVITRKIRDLCLSGDVEGLETLSDEGYDLVQAVTDPVLPSSPDDSPATVIFSEVCAGGLLDVCQYLHRMGVGLDHIDALGLTPLHYGVLNGHEGFVEWLLSEGVDMLEETKCESGPYCGMTSVHLCAVMGFVGIMKLLLESGAPVDCRRGGVGSTPLFEAVRSGQLEMVNYLCDSGCDVTCVTDENETILHAGAMSGKLKMMKRVRSLWIGRSLSNEESTGRRRSSSSSSGEGGRDIKTMDIEDSFGTTPFLLSCGVGKVSVMKYLTDEGCNIFHRGGREDRQNSALHFSVCGGHVDATSWLLDHGLNPESQNEAGKTPVDVARSLGMVELSNLLDANLSQFSAMDRAKSFLDPMLESALASEDFERGAVVLREMISMLSINPEEYVNDDGNTLLHLAAAVGSLDILSLISFNESSLLRCNRHASTPAHFAASYGHFSVFREFVLVHPVVSTLQDHSGRTILHIVSERNDLRFIPHLLDSAPECLSQKCLKGWTALHYACSRGHESIVKTLIDAGAKATIAEGGITPLHLACYNNHSDIAIYLICQSDVDVGHCDDSGMCALDIAESQQLSSVINTLYRGPPEESFSLNENQVVSYASGVFQDMFFTAVESKDIPLMKRMLQLGADVDFLRGKDGLAALHIACNLPESIDVIDFLLKSGSDIHTLSRDGLTSLHLACLNFKESADDLKLISHLFKNGASFNFLGALQTTPFHLVISSHSLSRHLLGTVITEKDIHPNIKNHLNQSSLHLAVSTGYLDSFDFLSQLKIYVDSQDLNGMTPLCFACRNGSYPMSLKLIEMKANVNLCDNDGQSPLSFACSSGNLKLVQLLVDHNADINSCTKSGDSLLHFACLHGRYAVAKWLVSVGLGIDCVNEKGMSPRSYGLQFTGNKSFQEWIATNSAL